MIIACDDQGIEESKSEEEDDVQDVGSASCYSEDARNNAERLYGDDKIRCGMARVVVKYNGQLRTIL